MRYLEIKRLFGSIALALSLAVSGATLPAAAQQPQQPGVMEESEQLEQGMQRGVQRETGRSNLGWLGLVGLLGLLGLRGAKQHHATRADTTTQTHRRAA